MRGLAVVAAALILAGCSMERPSQRFGLESSTTTAPTSTTEVAEVEEPEEVEPAEPAQPIELSGTGEQKSAPVNLSGSYVVDIAIGEDCGFFSPSLYTTAEGRLAEPLSSLSEPGERTTHVYGLPEGEYYLDVTSRASCPWSITLTPRP